MDSVKPDSNLPKDEDKKIRRVLVMCTHNSVRSPMAEALLKKALGREVYVQSAGVSSENLSVFAKEVMSEIDINIANHCSKAYTNLLEDSFDVIVALSPEAYEFARNVTENLDGPVEYWDVTSPPQMGEVSRESILEAYRRIRDELRQHIYNRLGVSV